MLIKEVTYETVKKWKAEDIPFQLIDVREASEHNVYNIGGLLIPLAEILKERNQLKTEQPVVFYCKKGIRSKIAIQKLLRYFPNGDFYNLKSGIGIKKVD